MTLQQVLKHYGTLKAAAAACGITNRQTYHSWKRRGIPPLRQFQIERDTKGKLKAA